EERIAFLRSAHPEVSYIVHLAENTPSALADEDLVKSVLVNLLENAAEAAGTGGRILAFTKVVEGRIAIEVHDSGPGLSEQARTSLFQPTISFKKRGMGIGLSIARKGALLSGGDIQLVDGELGGAAFRVLLPIATNGFQALADRGCRREYRPLPAHDPGARRLRRQRLPLRGGFRAPPRRPARR